MSHNSLSYEDKVRAGRPETFSPEEMEQRRRQQAERLRLLVLQERRRLERRLLIGFLILILLAAWGVQWVILHLIALWRHFA